MILTNKQEEGLKIAVARYKAHEPYTCIAGYAGTGKSTLIKFIISALNISEDNICYVAYTGKAAQVLRQKGCANPITAHKLLYRAKPMPNGTYKFEPKDSIDDYKIIVVDEVSMLPQELWYQLLSHGVYVLAMGDPGQLSPIGDETNTVLDNPHIFLDEIMRQAAESEIIQLTMKIRNGESLDLFKGNEVQIFKKNEFNTGMMTWADQIIVATNATRQAINQQMRDILGYQGLPQHGERMICLRNYWDDCNDAGDALVNGTTGIIENPFESFRRIPAYIKNDRRDLPTIVGNFIPDGGIEFHSIEMDKEMIMTGEKCVDWRVAYQLGKLKPKIGDIVPKEFAFAYAITCHKAQGSEWEKVLVVEEGFPFAKEEHARWLYTACTRASEKLVLLR